MDRFRVAGAKTKPEALRPSLGGRGPRSNAMESGGLERLELPCLPLAWAAATHESPEVDRSDAARHERRLGPPAVDGFRLEHHAVVPAPAPARRGAEPVRVIRA